MLWWRLFPRFMVWAIPDLYLKMMHLTVGMIIDQRARFCADWRSCNTLVMTKHSSVVLSVRGEVIDIFPAESDDIALRGTV